MKPLALLLLLVGLQGCHSKSHEVVAAKRIGDIKFYAAEGPLLIIDEDGDIFLRDKWIGKDSRLGGKPIPQVKEGKERP